MAVEVGFENLPFVQEDILCLCEAAHTPVILATQILESLAESGLNSSRNERCDHAATRRKCNAKQWHTYCRSYKDLASIIQY